MFIYIYIYIYIEHRNLGTRKTLTFYKRYYLRFFDIRREMHIFSILAFSSAPPHLVRHLPKASAGKWKSTLLVLCPVLNSTYGIFQNPPNPQNLPRASGAWRHPHSVAPVSHLCYCDISEWHALSARPRTPVLMLHLSNPCTEPKGSQPN